MSNPQANHSDGTGNGEQQPQYGAYAPTSPQASGPQQAGDTSQSSPFSLIEELLPRTATNAIRTLYGVIGIAAIVLGIALLIWPGRTLSIFAIMLGIYFVISGVAHFISAIVELGLPAGWRVLDCLVGVLLAVGGIVMLRNAMLSGQTLALFITMMVGIGWILEGVTTMAESWRVSKSGWAVTYAVLSIIAGIIILLYPLSSTIWLIIFTSITMIILGATAIIRAFTFGRNNH